MAPLEQVAKIFLHLLSRPVNPMNFDVTAVLKHFDNRGQYPTVQFDNPLNMHGEPSEFPIVSNLWATRERCAEAVGLPREKAGAELGSLFAKFVSKKLKVEKVIPGKSKSVVRFGPLKPGRYEFVGEFHEDSAKGVVVAE